MKLNLLMIKCFALLILINASVIHASLYEKITILTHPIGQYGLLGHYGVTRSLIEGFKKINQNFNVNPHTIEEVGDIVHVLCDTNALAQAISLKRMGRIKKLLAGPNLMVRSNECNHILASPEIDVCIVPSEWVKNAYIEDEPSLAGRIQCWPAGVDTSYWTPINKKATKKVLVYWKTESENFCSQVEDELKKHNWIPIRLRYGSYSAEHYKQILSEVAFAVFMSRTESQGIALAEAWAMNIPTLVWNADKPHIIMGKTYWPVSTAPYLTDAAGIFWKDVDELKTILERVGDLFYRCMPRDWVLQNMSDELCAQNLLKIINNIT